MKSFKAIEKQTAREAIEHAGNKGGTAIRYQGKCLVATRTLIDALDRASRRGLADFARLTLDRAGRVVTIPIG